MRYLLDVNVLIALLDADHAMHAECTLWFTRHARQGWASCPMTQNGCVRIMSHPGYPGALPIFRVAQRLAEATTDPHHAFWPDDISVLDDRIVDHSKIHGPKQVTDLYLLALAHHHEGCFVTFDGAVNLAAIRDAQPQRLVML